MSSREDTATGRRDPLSRHRFVVEVEDMPPIGFTDVHGLAVTVQSPQETEPVSTTTGEGSTWLNWTDLVDRLLDVGQPIPNRGTSTPNLELQRGVTAQVPLYRWLRDWVDGTIEARDVRISLLDGRNEPSVGWVCRAATPVEWQGPTLTADTAAVAMERLELAHDGISMVGEDRCE